LLDGGWAIFINLSKVMSAGGSMLFLVMLAVGEFSGRTADVVGVAAALSLVFQVIAIAVTRRRRARLFLPDDDGL
jgi:membrane carboxypeptidase/penicillin-binding protein PbpC